MGVGETGKEGWERVIVRNGGEREEKGRIIQHVFGEKKGVGKD